MRDQPSVFTVAPGQPFVDALAAGVMAGALGIDAGDPLALSRVTVLLPTRRAVRALIEAFLRRGAGRPMLLPRMLPLGEADEAAEDLDVMLAGAEPPPPALPEARRELLLAQLILVRWGGKRTKNGLSPDQAVRLARELAALMDQVDAQGLSFDGLAKLVPEDLAAHWQATLDFLKIVTEHWPKILATEGCIDAGRRRNLVLESQARRWQQAPPADPVIAAGSTGSLPATANLLAVVARLPRGAVVLPGLDRDLDEAAWQALDETHPQFAIARLLSRLEIGRAQVRDWPAPGVPETDPARAALISRALLPAAATESWAEAAPPPRAALAAVRRIDCATPREEAGVIALLLREALEDEGKRAALVTPDRGLARRVAAELRRFHIEVDDSGGTPLSDTPPGVFLRLAAAMIAEDCAPVPLLSALKHPLAALGESPGAFRAQVRELERAILRGPRPAPGFKGLRAALRAAHGLDSKTRRRLGGLLADLEQAARPFALALRRKRALVGALARAHAEFAETLAATDAKSGAERLWTDEAGEAASELMESLIGAKDDLPPIPGRSYPALLESMMAGRVVRPRYGRHPRLFIWGPLEARLQHVERMILGGLNEGTWPPAVRGDPWMSRPMRKSFGLPPPEWRVGLSAHDFAQCFCAPEVVLTRSERVEGSPTVPSRWLLRLDTLLAEENGISRGTDYLGWLDALDKPARVAPVSWPEPRPPLAARPRSLRVTEVETWLRDPYAIFARHILGLRPEEPIDAEPGAADRGSFIHRALDLFLKEYPASLPEDAEERLLACGRKTLGGLMDRPGVRAFWWPRFERIVRWFLAFEHQRRLEGIAVIATEHSGKITLPAPAGLFTLHARADRIDRLPSGGIAILDYKTGAVPSTKEVASFLAPQLPLEALIAREGGFEEMEPHTVAGLAYVRLTGREPPGELVAIGGDPAALAEAARARLLRFVAAFDDPSAPYRSRPRPTLARPSGDYDHLARVKEWSAGPGAAE